MRWVPIPARPPGTCLVCSRGGAVHGPFLETDPVQCDWHTAAFGDPEKVPVYLCRECFVSLGKMFGSPVEITPLNEAQARDEVAGLASVALAEAQARIEELEAELALEAAKPSAPTVDLDELLAKLGVPSTMIAGPDPVVEITSSTPKPSVSSARGGRHGKSSRS